ncbi:hypothetical protein Poly24_47760 [Rosistilla carotiformis]|uniref:Uncharacterized protein n=1 Tax=Rosistilla carotiformis TaxID=2528017 RepID=A0A518JZR8_9BACT|nr:hypothetical protein [Rosistilla carotiformis]QDV71043.1 hypothetical protein Poly24_47760 [Rosistilla carotiformis]
MNADEIQALLDAAPQSVVPATSVAVLNEVDEVEPAAEAAAEDEQPGPPEFAFGGDEPEEELKVSVVDESATSTVQVQPAPQEMPSEPAASPIAAPQVAAIATGPASIPMWIKGTAGVALVLSIAATTLGFINRSVLEARIEQLDVQNVSLRDRCDFQQALCQQLMGNPGDPDKPFWDVRSHVLNLDQAFLAQVPTQVGSVNVIRSRPTSLNERTQLHFEITNPNALTLHRGQLIVRTSSVPHDPGQDYDYEALRAWYKTVKTTTYEIGELRSGQTRVVEASAGTADDSDPDPQYVDFQVTFGYYSANDSSLATASAAE